MRHQRRGQKSTASRSRQGWLAKGGTGTVEYHRRAKPALNSCLCLSCTRPVWQEGGPSSCPVHPAQQGQPSPAPPLPFSCQPVSQPLTRLCSQRSSYSPAQGPSFLTNQPLTIPNPPPYPSCQPASQPASPSPVSAASPSFSVRLWDTGIHLNTRSLSLQQQWQQHRRRTLSPWQEHTETPVGQQCPAGATPWSAPMGSLPRVCGLGRKVCVQKGAAREVHASSARHTHWLTPCITRPEDAACKPSLCLLSLAQRSAALQQHCGQRTAALSVAAAAAAGAALGAAGAHRCGWNGRLRE